MHSGALWHFVDASASLARLPMRNPAWHRESARTFVALHAERPFDVVHSESTSALGLLHRRLHRSVPVVAKFHGNYLGFVRAGVRRAVSGGGAIREAKSFAWVTGKHFLTRGNWYAFRQCENMVPSFAQLRDTCISHALKRSRTHVVPNGIDTKVFSPGSREAARARLGLEARPLFLCVGSLYREKGVRHAIRALAMLDHEPRPGLLVVGDGEERPSLEALARDLGIADRVVFAGRQPRDRVVLYMHASDAFVFPTELPEAAPLSLPQAMATGLPAIASRVGAVPEVINRPGNGILVPPGAVGELARAMHQLVNDERRRHELGGAARKRIVEAFTLERMIDRTTAVYDVALLTTRSD